MSHQIRKIIGLGLVAIATLSLISIFDITPFSTASLPALRSRPIHTVAQASERFAQVMLTADADRLAAHVAAIAYPRFDEVDRIRARGYLIEQLTSFGWQVQLASFAEGTNLIADKPGTDAEAGRLVVGAHFDTVKDSPGADDNASAVAALLEIARLFGRQSHPRSLQLVFFDQEESGLLGSLAYAENAANLDKTMGAIILEMLGYSCDTAGCQRYPGDLPFALPSDRGNFIGVIGDLGHPELLSAFQATERANLPPAITLPIPLSPSLPADLLRSDHAPLWQKGIGAVLVTDTANFRNPHYHQPTDTAETLDFQFLTGVTQRVIDAVELLLKG
ncbi:M20/M25/M40 family metallo-hydrolase [Almyronema epifaneia]|uniref:M20/M25/M40 family metallo-hydrolase n=1 Tax=Almyronema epifaneia S1 TaxID=2991925 RepID=A0ABW6IBX8_9CYAN